MHQNQHGYLKKKQKIKRKNSNSLEMLSYLLFTFGMSRTQKNSKSKEFGALKAHLQFHQQTVEFRQ